MSYSVLLESISDPDKCNFVQKPPEYLHLKCPVCFDILLPEPHLATCCGNHFCKKCIESLRRNDPCPLCKAEGNTNLKVPDKGLAKALNSLEIFCPNNDKLCEWEGPLGTIHNHLSTSCEYVLVPCRHGCDFSVMRKELATHEAQRCPKRPVICKHCQTYSATYVQVLQHEKTCPKGVVNCPNRCGVSYPREEQSKHMDHCPNVPMPCTFKYAGCMWVGPKGQYEEHLDFCWRDHISMVDTHLNRAVQSHEKTLTKLTAQVKNQNKQLNTLSQCVKTMESSLPPPSHNVPTPKTKSSSASQSTGASQSPNPSSIPMPCLTPTIPPPTVTPIAPPPSPGIPSPKPVASCVPSPTPSLSLPTKMKFVIKHFEKKRTYNFFCSPPFISCGYSMLLTVYLNGIGETRGTYISVYVNILSKEYQKWSASKFIPIKTNIMVKLESQVVSKSSHQVGFNFETGSKENISTFMSSKGTKNGTPTFIKLTELTPFLKNDKLTFEISYH